MTSRSTPKITVDRGKALRFISKQEFYKMEATAQEKGNVRVLERDWYKKSRDNESYAQEICSYSVKRHLILLEKVISCCDNKDPKRMQLIATRDHIKQKTQICINNKILQFYQFVGLQQTAPFMFMHQQSPFVVNNGYYPYAQLQGINPMSQLKRQKVCHSKRERKMITKTKEDIENEKIIRLTLPQNLINCSKLKLWLDDKLNTLKEYEALIIKNNCNLKEKKSAIKNLRRDIDILKCTVLQENNGSLSQNKELKKIYLDIMKMDLDLPILRKKCILPLISSCCVKFKRCHVLESVDAQKDIKNILIKNKFDEQAKEYCNLYNFEIINHELFESQINNVLNDDLELLKDFGVKFNVEKVNEFENLNLRITFCGHFNKEIDNEWIPPNLIIMIDETKYKHYYQLFGKQFTNHIEFDFVLKVNHAKFTQKHIKWMQKYKENTLKRNGHFVSIVNIYNFYIDAVKVLIREMCDKTE